MSIPAKALLIEILDWHTGERAGGMKIEDLRPGGRFFSGIDPYGTLSQSLSHEPKGNYELRLITNGTLDGLNELMSSGGEIVLSDGSRIRSPLTSLNTIPSGLDIINVVGVVLIEGEKMINLVADLAIPRKYRFAQGCHDMRQVITWCEEQGKPLPFAGPQKKDTPDILEEAYKRGCPFTRRLPRAHVRNGRWVEEED